MPIADPAVRSTLTTMLGRPFGNDESGRPIDHGSGRLIIGAISCLQDLVAKRVGAESPALPAEELAAKVADAQAEALTRLVTMLNAAIPDPRYHLTEEYLLNPNNLYSYEFRLFVSDFCREISGDTNFFRHAGERSIPAAVGLLGRPLGIQRTYALLPPLTAKVIKTDLRVLQTTPTSAIVQWYGAGQAGDVPEPHREAYIRFACQIYQGAYSAVPTVVFGLPNHAGVRELRCQAEGADCCEWQFNWSAGPATAGRKLLFAGGAASVGLAAAYIVGAPLEWVLALAGATLPAALAWHRFRARHLTTERDNYQQLLLEERDLAEDTYDRSEEANGGLQRANVELSQRLRELTALQDASLALSSIRNADEILEASLQAIIGQLGFERAMVLLGDDERQVLCRGMSAGTRPEMATLVANLEVRYDAEASPLIAGFNADAPVLYDGVEDSPSQTVRDFVQALGAARFIVAPLITKGRRIGVLAVDNAITGRALDVQAGSLLMTLGQQMAGAIEMANLQSRLEAHNRTLLKQVQELRIEIDGKRQAKQVADIVSTEYFQSLRSQAHDLRRMVSRR